MCVCVRACICACVRASVCIHVHVYFHVCSVYCTGYGRYVVCICVSMFFMYTCGLYKVVCIQKNISGVPYLLPVMLYLFVMAFSLWSFGGPGSIIPGRDKQYCFFRCILNQVPADAEELSFMLYQCN